ncbi:putative peptidase [Rhypophila sp. PSN 637]
MGRFSSFRLAAVVLSTTSIIAAPAPVPQVTPSPAASVAPNPNACAQIASVTDSLLAASPSATPTVPATLAVECLATVPNKPEPAARLVKSLRAFVAWQSSLAFLKDPPPGYVFPAVDIDGGLANISTTAEAGGFASEFDFQLAIVKLIVSAHDGHFVFRPDIFKAFVFRNRLAFDIVTVSEDGVQIPKLYHLAGANSTTGGPPFQNTTLPRAIVKINGEDAATVIERQNLIFSPFQDPDSQWNGGMASYAQPNVINFVASAVEFSGPSLTLTYDNGQEETQDSFAVVRAGADFTGITNGDDFYNRFCNPEANGVVNTAAVDPDELTEPSTLAGPAAPTIQGYPTPIIRDSGANITHGYFLNGTGYEDVAVLAVNGFSPAGDFDGLEYLNNLQTTLETFLAECKAQSKQKLVIDLSGNGGGYVVAGYELFAQLFPSAPKFQANNLRETSSLRSMAEITNRFLDQINTFDLATVTSQSESDAQEIITLANSAVSTFAAGDTSAAQAQAFSILQRSSIVSNIVPGGVFAPDGSNLTTIDEILEPVILKNDRFTAYQSTPLNQTSSTWNLTGTGHRSNPPPAVFKPENVVLLTDGTCGSTCTLFSYLMIHQLGIKTTVLGGRPQTGPMQSVGGVEGAQVFYLNELSAAAKAVLLLDPASNITDSELSLIDEGYAIMRAANPSSPGAVNGKNAFSRLDSQNPLQFLYQSANCRVFWTREMLFDPLATWKKVVDATWGDSARLCVQGSRETDERFFERGGRVNPVVPDVTTAGAGRIEGGIGMMATVVVGLSLGLGLVI